jgi:hypothetical protein
MQSRDVAEHFSAYVSRTQMIRLSLTDPAS